MMGIQSPFLWGSKGEKLTPEQVERRRAQADAMLQGVGDTSPVDHWLQGAGRVVNAITGKVKERRADASEALGMAGADDYIKNNGILSGLIGSGGSGASVGMAQGLSGGAGSATPMGANAAAGDVAQPPAALTSDGGGPMDVAARAIGLNEGDKKAALSDYLKTGGQNLDPATTAWCAAFVDSTLKQSGSAGTGKLNARSYMDWGQAVDEPQRGDVAVFSRGDPNGWQGHVGFFDSYNPDGTIKVLGGNQGDSVSLANYSPDSLLGFRRGGGGMSPQGQPTPITGGGSSVVAALAAAMSDPWVAKKYGPAIQALMGQEMKRGDMQYQQQLAQSDPAYQMGLEKSRMEIDAMRNPAAPKPIEVGGVLLDPTTYQPIFDSRQPQGGDGFTLSPGQQRFDAAGNAIAAVSQPADPGFTMVPPNEVASLGLPPGAYQRGADGKIMQVGGQGVTVNNNMGEDKFGEAFAKGDAAALGTISESGMAAQRNMGRIDQLEGLLSASPTGLAGAAKLAAGEWGIDTAGLTELQAAQALINTLVPEQRQPGSGPMSDADLALFKQSLPRIINQPGGNEIILNTMRGIAQYDAEGAQIVQELRAGSIDRAEAFSRLQGRANPMQGFKSPAQAAPTAQPQPTQGEVVPQGVDPEDWKYMTPEQKAIFQ